MELLYYLPLHQKPGNSWFSGVKFWEKLGGYSRLFPGFPDKPDSLKTLFLGISRFKDDSLLTFVFTQTKISGDSGAISRISKKIASLGFWNRSIYA